MTPYLIHIQGRIDGTLRGASVTDTPTAQPRPVRADDWPALIEGINASAFERITEMEAALAAATAERDAARASLASHQQISDGVLIKATAFRAQLATAGMPAPVLAALDALLTEAALAGPAERQRAAKLAALAAKRAALEAEAAALAALG